MLWLAIHLPALPLEVLSPAGPEAGPLAVSAHTGSGDRVIDCNAAARAAGVRPGMPVAAARALLSGLRVRRQAPDRERQALEGVALWAGQFTASVVLSPPRGVILEIAASLRLFRGVEPLLQQVRPGLDELGHRAALCVAPTPGGALCLAEAGCEGRLLDREALKAALAGLRLDEFPLSPGERDLLNGMGLGRVADLLALPRAGLSRRTGPELAERLDRLLGSRPDPRPLFRPPERFSRRLELPCEVAGGTALLFAAKRLLMELAGFLAARQAGAQQLHWELVHGAAEPTRFTLGLLAPGHRAAGFLDLLRERLERLVLPAPVRAIGLRVDRLHPLEAVSLPLFAEGGRGAARDESLLDRLRARLGEGAVRGLGQRPDHRPERAWSFCAPGMPSAALERPAGPRPLWLLAQPQPLEVRGGWPCWNGPLRLEPERERIESGWWDGRDVARDYFLARTGSGERLWVYREIGGCRLWFLHGFF